MTHRGMVLLVLFANTAALCLWLYWRERQVRRAIRAKLDAAERGLDRFERARARDRSRESRDAN